MTQKIKIIISVCFLSTVLIAFQNCGNKDAQTSEVIEESLASSELSPEDPTIGEVSVSAANTPQKGWYHHIFLGRGAKNTSYYVWSSGRFCIHNGKKYGKLIGTSDASRGAYPGFNHSVFTFFSNGLWNSSIYRGNCRY